MFEPCVIYMKEKFCCYFFVVVFVVIFQDRKDTAAATIASKEVSVYPPSTGMQNNKNSFQINEAIGEVIVQLIAGFSEQQ